MEIKEISIKQTSKIIHKYFSKMLDHKKAYVYLSENGSDLSDISDKTNPEQKTFYVEEISKVIYGKLLKDIEFIASTDPSITDKTQLLSSKTKTLIATMFYRISNFFYYENLCKDTKKCREACRDLMEEALTLTSIDIHPGARIDEEFFIDHGANLVIGETVVIGKKCTLFNNVILGSKNVINAVKNTKRHPTLLDNVTICAGAKILGDIVIGNNVFVSPNAVVLEDIEDDNKVIITNQLQLTKNTKLTVLPSQKLIVYGIVPKFKNTIMILGEGFYNPTVLIKLKNNKEINYAITYWDKNKITLKIKNTTPLDKDVVLGGKVVVLSNSSKVVILNSIGLQRALTTLTD